MRYFPLFNTSQVVATIALNTSITFLTVLYIFTLAHTMKKLNIDYIRWLVLFLILRFRNILIFVDNFGLIVIDTLFELKGRSGRRWHFVGIEFNIGVVGIELGELIAGEVIEVGIGRVGYFWLVDGLVWRVIIEAI